MISREDKKNRNTEKQKTDAICRGIEKKGKRKKEERETDRGRRSECGEESGSTVQRQKNRNSEIKAKTQRN